MTEAIQNILYLTGQRKRIAVINARLLDYDFVRSWLDHYTGNMDDVCFITGGSNYVSQNNVEWYAICRDLPCIVMYLENEPNAVEELEKRIIEAATSAIIFYSPHHAGSNRIIELARQKNIKIVIVNI